MFFNHKEEVKALNKSVRVLNDACDTFSRTIKENRELYLETKSKLEEEIHTHEINERRLINKIKALEMVDFSKGNTIKQYISEIAYLKGLLDENGIPYNSGKKIPVITASDIGKEVQ